jgi:hypothetical protein
VLTAEGRDAFAAEYLRARDLGWAADLLAGFPGTLPSDPSQQELPL